MNWLATPAAERLPHTAESFRRQHRCSIDDLLMFHVEPGFLERVAGCIEPHVRRIAHIREAIYRNAMDHSRRDQWEWMRRFEAMVAAAGGDALRFLPGSDHDAKIDRERAARSRTDEHGGEALIHIP